MVSIWVCKMGREGGGGAGERGERGGEGREREADRGSVRKGRQYVFVFISKVSGKLRAAISRNIQQHIRDSLTTPNTAPNQLHTTQ